MSVILGMAFLALAYRLRGWDGWLWGTFSRRVFWAVCVTFLFIMFGIAGSGASVAGYLAPQVAIGAFAGMWISHGAYFDVGKVNGSVFGDAALLALIGAARMALICLPWGWRVEGAFPLLAAVVAAFALWHSMAYLLGKWAAYEIRLYPDPIAIAEPLVGAGVAAGMAYLILL